MPQQYIDPNKVISVILGGGEGTRLFPLTKERAKPAVPLAGKYRFVDIPISLSINSGIKRIFLLTQYLSSSLHRHVQQSYQFDFYQPRGFIEILAAQKTRSSTSWYQGTADAVRQNMMHFNNHRHEYVLILSGDQLYRMDYRELISQHIESGADLTVATVPVLRDAAKGFGIMHVNASSRIIRFVEKPKDNALLESLRLPQQSLTKIGAREDDELFLASMGIYVFNRELLNEAFADESKQDFGKDIIPSIIESKKVHAYIHQGYWEDIGTIRAYYEASLDLVCANPRFNFYDAVSPIYSRGRSLPGSKILDSVIQQALIGDGCMLSKCEINHSLLGIRSIIGAGTKIRDSILMGADFYETPKEIDENLRFRRPNVGIGENCLIEKSIVDKNARIGKNVTIRPDGKPKDMDHELFYIRDGIVVIPKGVVVPDGTVI